MIPGIEVRRLALDGLGAEDEARLAALLDESERARAARFRFAADRLSYVAAHAMGRVLLSEFGGGPPQDWRFVEGPHGRPEAVMPAGAPRLRLNLSHTRGLAAAALTVDHDIGIDVERLDRSGDFAEIARRFFAPEECAALAAVPPERTAETFLAFWTLKEAYIKAVGAGLSLPLESFAFTLEPLSIRFAPGTDDDPAGWHFARLNSPPGYAMALAVRSPDPGDVRVEVFEF